MPGIVCRVKRARQILALFENQSSVPSRDRGGSDDDSNTASRKKEKNDPLNRVLTISPVLSELVSLSMDLEVILVNFFDAKTQSDFPVVGNRVVCRRDLTTKLVVRSGRRWHRTVPTFVAPAMETGLQRAVK